MIPRPQQLFPCIDPGDQSETMCLQEMTSVGARIQSHKEWMNCTRDRTPYMGVLIDTEQWDPSHHDGMNCNPVHSKRDNSILQAKCAYIWHTGQMPFLFLYCFTPIIYFIDVDKRFVRQTWVLTWIPDSRQVSTSFIFLLWLYKAYSPNGIQNHHIPIENFKLSNHRYFSISRY